MEENNQEPPKKVYKEQGNQKIIKGWALYCCHPPYRGSPTGLRGCPVTASAGPVITSIMGHPRGSTGATQLPTPPISTNNVRSQ